MRNCEGQLSPVPSIFHNHWWLDAASDGKWQSITAGPRSGVIASMPIMFTHKFLGQGYIGMPPLTRVLGPIFTRVSPGPELSDLAHFRLLRELIARLPHFIGFAQLFDPRCNNLLAFQLSGFSIGVHFTFRIENCSDPGQIWMGMRDKTRNEIRRAEDSLQVFRSSDIATFVKFYEANLRRSGKSMTTQRSLMQRILDAAVANKAGESLFCRTVDGDLSAAVFIVWDDQYYYFILSTRDGRVAGNGSMSLLLWTALQLAGQAYHGFDFDGFFTYSGADFIRQFGGHLVPRWSVLRWSRLIRAAQLFRSSRIEL
jgi:hypothetical protein